MEKLVKQKNWLNRKISCIENSVKQKNQLKRRNGSMEKCLIGKIG